MNRLTEPTTSSKSSLLAPIASDPLRCSVVGLSVVTQSVWPVVTRTASLPILLSYYHVFAELLLRGTSACPSNGVFLTFHFTPLSTVSTHQGPYFLFLVVLTHRSRSSTRATFLHVTSIFGCWASGTKFVGGF